MRWLLLNETIGHNNKLFPNTVAECHISFINNVSLEDYLF